MATQNRLVRPLPFSIANQILIFGYNRNSSIVYEAEYWKEMGLTVTDPGHPIHVMFRAPEKDKTGYIDRELYDISQTNGEVDPLPGIPDKGAACEALLMAAPCKIQYVDHMRSRGSKAMYDAERDIIEVTKGCESFDMVFAALSVEYAHYEYAHLEARQGRKGYQRGRYGWDAFSTAYALGSRFGMDVSQFQFHSFPPSWSEKNATPADIRHELDLVTGCCKRLEGRVMDQWHKIQQSQKGQVMEHA
jgi:hypothetical protein